MGERGRKWAGLRPPSHARETRAQGFEILGGIAFEHTEFTRPRMCETQQRGVKRLSPKAPKRGRDLFGQREALVKKPEP